MRQSLTISGKSAILIFILSLVAWLTGSVFIFPSLGPTAYLLAFDSKFSHSAKVVIGGHMCGVFAGLVSYHLIVSPLDFTMIIAPVSSAVFYIGLGAVVSIAITSFMMILFRVSHPPACATTLIISLGILPDWTDGLVIIAAVSLLYITYWVFQKAMQRTDVE